MTKNVLIVDSDKSFSVIIKETLNNHPLFTANLVHSGADAIRYLVNNSDVDLVIIDMGVADAEPAKLVEATRELHDGMSVMIIPLIGQDVPLNVKQQGLQGILPKPFFVGDLPKLVGQAVGLDLESEVPEVPKKEQKSAPAPKAPAPKAPAPKAEAPKASSSKSNSEAKTASNGDAAPPARTTSTTSTAVVIPTVSEDRLRNLRKNVDEVIDHLKNLTNDVGADVALLTAGAELIARAGNMKDERAQELAILVAESAAAASRAAKFLGERDGRFEQTLHEGSQHSLYSYSVSEGIFLSLSLGPRVPIGMVRHQTKRTGKNISKYVR